MKNRIILYLIGLTGIIFFNWYFKLISINASDSEGEFKVLSCNIHSKSLGFVRRSLYIANLITNETPDFVYLTEYYEGAIDSLDSIFGRHYPFFIYKTQMGG